MFQLIFLSLGAVLYVGAAVMVVRLCLRTRDAGFVWLGVAFFAWPSLSALLQRGERTLAFSRHGASIFPFSLVTDGQMTEGSLLSYLLALHYLIGAGLAFVAILLLSKGRVHEPPMMADKTAVSDTEQSSCSTPTSCGPVTRS